MKIRNRKYSAVFLAAVMLLQFVFTIPAEVFADTNEEQRGTVVEAFSLVRQNEETAALSHVGEELMLQIEWSHESPGENPVEETVIQLPDELITVPGEKEVLDYLGISAGKVEVKEHEVLLSMNQNEEQLRGILEIPVQIGALEAGNHILQFIVHEEVRRVEITIEELMLNQTAENQPVEEKAEENVVPDVVLEEEPADELMGSIDAESLVVNSSEVAEPEASVNELELEGPTEIDKDQFKFNNIYFLDNTFDQEVDDPKDFIFDVDRPYDLNIKDNYGLLYFDFSLIDGHAVKAGDTFTFRLPEELKPVSGIKGELGSIGKWFVDLSGTVRFEFNEGVNGDDVEGFFWFSVNLDETKMDETIVQEIQFENYPDFVMRFPVEPKNGSLLNKNGTINNNGYNSSEAYWSVDINTSLGKLVSASVSDVIPTNMILKEGSLQVYRLDVTSGGVKTEGALLEADKYVLATDTDGNPRVSFTGLTGEEASKAYRITYTTEIVEPSAGFDGTQTFTNKVVLTNDEKNYTSASTVSSGYGKAIDKLNPSYDAVNQTFDWTINYNFNEKYINEDRAYLTDTWTPKGAMKLISEEFNVYPVTMDNSGNAVVSDMAMDSSMYTLLENGSDGFTLTFKEDINRTAYQIRYKTKLLGLQGTGIVENGGKVTNKVETGTEKSDGSSGSWSQRGVIKSSTRTNVKEKEIDWRILLNQNGYLMENLVITDTFSGDGLTLLAETMKITGKNNRIFVLGTDYTVSYTAPVVGTSSGGFIITFNAPVNEPLTLTYTTHFERNSDGSASYGNKAKISWKENGKEYSSETGVIKVTPAGYTGPNGVKNGYYDAKTKEITWSIHTNYARLPIENGYKISDVIPLHQEMVEGSLEVFSYNVDNKGTIKDGDLLNEDSYGVTLPGESNGNRLEVELMAPHIGTENSIGIRFRTKFVGEWIRDPKVRNIAEFTNGGESFALEATVTIPSGGEYIHKTGIQTGIYNERVDWTVYMNRSQSLIKGYTLKDNPDLNSVLLEDSFILYKTVVSENGKITRSSEILLKGIDYDLLINTDNETGKQNFTLKFAYDIKDAFILEYSSYIDPLVGKGEVISNAYTANGITTEEVTDGDVSNEVKNINSGGAGGSSVRGGLQIRKTDEKNPERALEGAHFNLYTKDGKQLLRTGATDAEGNVKFGGLRRGDYLLKEIEAPAGYVISKALAEGVLLTLSHENDGEFELITYKNALTKINLRKVDEDGRIIRDEAVFALYKENGTLISQNLKTSDGLLTIEDLEEGKYYLQETKAPEGYILEAEKMNFTIEINEDGTQQVPTVNVANYKGQTEFIKMNDQGNPLEGAMFDLYSGQDRVRTGLVSDHTGTVRITDLAPGTYQVREAKAPAGYLLNTDAIQLTIPQSVLGKPEVFRLDEFRNYQGMVKLLKVDEKGNPIEGAQFELRNKETGLIIEDGLATDENGVILVKELAPGEYIFLEVSAPKGYITNREPLGFTVGEAFEGAPEIILAGEFINYKGSAILEKTDEEGNPLEGALFDVLDEEGNLMRSDISSDKEGDVFIDHLSPGKYQFVETRAPEGYLLNLEMKSFEINAETYREPVTVKAGTLVNYKGKAVLSKTDESGHVLKDAVFNVTDEKGSAVIENLRSDENGVVTAEGLAPGTYFFEETKAPEGFIRNELKIAFSIMDENEGAPSVVEAGSLQNYKGSVEWHKVNDKGEGLEGALFDVTDEKGIAVHANLSSDETGKVTIEGLAPGDYTILETRAPLGFIRNLDTQSFTIEMEAEGIPETVLPENFTNYQGRVILTKTDAVGLPLEGAAFELSLDGEKVSLWTTDEDGKIFIENLQPGKYSLVEVESPEGFILDQTSYDFTVTDEEHGEPAAIQAGHAMNHKGGMVLEKVDEKGQQLEGAVFEIRDAGENLISRIESDENGLVKASDLAPGQYTVEEVEAPKGYVRNTETLTFTIEALSMGKPEEIDLGIFVNYRGKMRVEKVDSMGNPLKDAEFEIVDADGNTYREKLLSDGNGEIMVSDMAPGRYSLVEVNAPEGYRNDDQKYDFEITESHEGEPVEIVMTVVNEKMPEEEPYGSLPRTGTKDSGFYFALLGILFIAAGFFYLNKQRRRA